MKTDLVFVSCKLTEHCVDSIDDQDVRILEPAIGELKTLKTLDIYGEILNTPPTV